MKPLFSLKPDDRFAVARRLVGSLVDVEIDGQRDGNVRTYRGVLLAVATPITGGQSDVGVIRPASGNDLAFSLATVRTLRPHLR